MPILEKKMIPKSHAALDSEHIGERKGTWRLRSRRLIGKIAIAGVLFAPVSVGVAGQYYADDPLVIPRHAVDLIVNDGMDPVPDATRQLIDGLADEPADVEAVIRQMEYMETDDDNTLYPAEEKPEMNEEYADKQEYLMVQANKYGLRISDPRPFRERIATAESVDELLNLLNAYGRTLGIDISVHEKTDIKDIGWSVEPLDIDDVDIERLRNYADGFVGIAGTIPKELFAYAKIHEVRIVKPMTGYDNPLYSQLTPAGKTNPIAGIIYLPESNMSSRRVVVHEIAHRVDYMMNGESLVGMWRDKEYARLNEQASSGEKAYVSKYAETNILEDKATMMEKMLSGLDSQLLNSEHFIIREKYRLLLARLEYAVPGMGEFLLATSPHHEHEE